MGGLRPPTAQEEGPNPTSFIAMRSLRNSLLTLFFAAPVAARSQVNGPPTPAIDTTEALAIFLDCRAPGCDFNYLRTELTWVNYVRDRTDAQIHVIATALGTGSGGFEAKLNFIGYGPFAGIDDEVKYFMPRGTSGHEQRAELTRVLKLALVRYVLRTSSGQNLSVNFTPSPNTRLAKNARDPWNFWVFSIGLNASIGGESRSSGRSGSGSFTASRTTAEWKFRANANGSTSRSSYKLGDTADFIARSHSYSGGSMLVRSIHSRTLSRFSGLTIWNSTRR